VASNVWPQATLRYTELAISSKLDGLFPTWSRATKALFSVSNPIPVKALLHAKSLISTPELRPPLTAKELSSTAELLTADREITAWLMKLSGQALALAS
jgi:dihydrodipicolinate synthase/N-acetylneuraminate lyase